VRLKPLSKQKRRALLTLPHRHGNASTGTLSDTPDVGVPSTLSCGRNFPFRERQQPKPQICCLGFLYIRFLGTLTIETNSVRQRKSPSASQTILRAQNHRGKTPGAGRRVQFGAQPSEASNRLTRRPATHNRPLIRAHGSTECASGGLNKANQLAAGVADCEALRLATKVSITVSTKVRIRRSIEHRSMVSTRVSTNRSNAVSNRVSTWMATREATSEAPRLAMRLAQNTLSL
jgi:hypothetical protein